MSKSRYQEIADALRERIQAGEWPVGSKLPGISTLQEEYGVPGLNTIRAAQQLLVEEGMIVTKQGVGATVVSTTSLRQVDVLHLLRTARGAVVTAIAALEAPKRITLDLNDADLSFVVTDALSEWASRQRHEAQDELADDPQDTTAASRLRQAEIADALLARIEAAL
ncbi:GntR family transcriptional regulator [Thermomonospora umbrina]|uniref:Regulatory GntR family protein n=1 Tax=Thermomonospora umbrina TaxID=111806 RepID=A0A3D9SYF6_9ACTN|nr:GntR family transcriptional regulator [Thermomonospora umbrina]REF00608.1 regulatory GntR family protein [Thermomonospora umbrina]